MWQKYKNYLIAGLASLSLITTGVTYGYSSPNAQPYRIDQSGTGSATTTRFFGTVSPQATNQYDLGEVAYSWRNIYASGTVVVNGSNVCLQSGTNCPGGIAAPTLQQVLVAGNTATSTPIFYGGLLSNTVVVTSTLSATSTATDNLTFSNGTGTSLFFTYASGTSAGTLQFGTATGTSWLALTSGLRLATGGQILVNNANPFKTLILSGAGGICASTNGCSATQYAFATQGTNFYALDFDATTTKYASWGPVALPNNYDGGTLSVTIDWMNSATGTGSILWGIQAKAIDASSTIDGVWGTAIYATSTAYLANFDYTTSTVSNLTIGGTPTGGKSIIFRAWRQADNALDTFGTTSTINWIKLKYGVSAFSE